MKRWRGKGNGQQNYIDAVPVGQDYRFIVNVEDNQSNWLIKQKLEYPEIIEIFSLPLPCHLILS